MNPLNDSSHESGSMGSASAYDADTLDSDTPEMDEPEMDISSADYSPTTWQWSSAGYDTALSEDQSDLDWYSDEEAAPERALTSNRAVDAVIGDFSSVYHNDCTPLHSAVIKGFDEEVEQLLQNSTGSDIHARYYGKTPLQYALDQRSANIADMLLHHGARLSPDDAVYYETEDMRWASRQSWYDELHDALEFKNHRPWLAEEKFERIFSLLAKVFPEVGIVRDIMNMAECWLVSSTTRKGRIRIDEHTPSRPYITSPAISGRKQHPVQRIVFKTVSHDQAWGGEGHRELYRGSWSWFEVTSSSNSQPVEVQRNVAVSGRWRTHVVIWDMHSPPHIVKWLADLKAGDTASLFAKALYPGWVNAVASAEMCIYTSFV